jgi:phage gpG-like protein
VTPVPGIRIEGLAELTGALERMAAALSVATRAATAEASHLVEAEIKRTLSTSSHAKGTPTPSSPGDPPSLVTGTLRRSVTVKGPHPLGSGRWEAEIGPTAVYGRIQELGGVTGCGGSAVLPPRPYVQPAFTRLAASGALLEAYHSRWRRAIASV